MAAAGTYYEMGEEEKGEEMEELHARDSKLRLAEYNATRPSDVEDVEYLKRACAEFIDFVKDTEEYNLDLEEAYLQLESTVKEEIAKLAITPSLSALPVTELLLG